ncbi:unnamed protein product [Porites evermanni]|uniref:Uncharacterized protein n=1 Tax=Porites evermanni TaxID=104178 RepID=A0ABN8PKP1_9CNID|nr:unnamed protein product [Porites evermanni]
MARCSARASVADHDVRSEGLYYCSSVWSNTSVSNIRKLQGVQNFAARIVSGTRKFDHVSPALKDLRWIPPVSKRRHLGL